MRHLIHTRKRARPGASHRSCLELLEQRTVLSAVPFGDPQVIAEADPQFFDVFAADLDGDNDLDTLVANFRENRVAWYENTDGEGNFGPLQVITENAEGASSVFAADLDNDGDMDVLSASPEDNKIAWYENIDGIGQFGPQQVITQDAGHAGSVFAVDLDNDGDMDVLSGGYNSYSSPRSDGTIAWYENTDGAGAFGPRVVITTVVAGQGWVFVADIDNDGNTDVIATSYRYNAGDISDSKLIWCRNDDAGNFGPQRVIAESANETFPRVHAADIDGDGDVDIVATSNPGVSYGTNISWYENQDGQGNFGGRRLIDHTGDSVFSIVTADLDGDGHLDVVAVGTLQEVNIAWYENMDGAGTFGTSRMIANASGRSVFIGDLDADGDLDVLGNREWYENSDGVGNFGSERIIGPGRPVRSTLSADLDGDQDMDVIAWSRTDVVWHENDGTGRFGEQQLVARTDLNLYRAALRRPVTATDLDGDGDLDVLCSGTAKIVWYENTNGGGSFGPERVIYEYGDGVNSFITTSTVADLDGDNDPDLVAIAGTWGDYRTLVVKNAGAGTFEAPIEIARNTYTYSSYPLSTADLDGDGDLDLLAPEHRYVFWYENRDGAGTFFGPRRAISERKMTPDSAVAVDLDGDADLDVLVMAEDTVIWYENTDGTGTFGPENPIAAGGASNGPTGVFFSDVDGDGDQDVLTHWRGSQPRKRWVAWYENTDGAGDFGPENVIFSISDSIYSRHLVDLDGDRDLDLLTGLDGQIVWSENLQAHPGDANRDGIFTSTDLVEVFTAGEYEDGVPENSTWEEGDWNGDREFDSGDLVLAFQEGLYEFKSRVLASEIAAAVDWLFSNDESMKRGKAYVA